MVPRIFSISSAVLVASLLSGCSSIGRKYLFYPTHQPSDSRLAPWVQGETLIGYSREVRSPENVWLMFHGNGGQASDRVYAIPSFSANDSVYILEYPGYGSRPGRPSRATFDRAAWKAYVLLRESHPDIPICVAGESIGSGPASSLASLEDPPDKIALVVPFQKLSKVARERVPSLLVGLLLADDWDNSAALAHYRRPIDIFGAKDDTLIPVRHAKALAADLPSANFFLIEGGHNTWARDSRVRFRNP